MDHPVSHALAKAEPAEYVSYDGHGTGCGEVQSLFYQCIPLGRLNPDEAISLCRALFSPEERFAKGFYHYWREVLHLPEAQAWQATLDELNEYFETITANLCDPHFYAIGFNQQGKFTPVGIFAFRSLEDHPVGPKLRYSIEKNGLAQKYQGNLAIAHTFSSLSDYRNRAMMKYAFLRMAFKALEHNFQHIFFFMSDHRLGPIYSRFGLEFPPNLTLPDSKHLVGSYSITPRHLEDIRKVAEQFGETMPGVNPNLLS